MCKKKDTKGKNIVKPSFRIKMDLQAESIFFFSNSRPLRPWSPSEKLHFPPCFHGLINMILFFLCWFSLLPLASSFKRPSLLSLCVCYTSSASLPCCLRLYRGLDRWVQSLIIALKTVFAKKEWQGFLLLHHLSLIQGEKRKTLVVGGEEERRRTCEGPGDLRDVWCSRRKHARFRDSRTCMEVVISCRAESASCCLVFRSALCSAARLFSSSTSALASFSLDTPACRKTRHRETNRADAAFQKCFFFSGK